MMNLVLSKIPRHTLHSPIPPGMVEYIMTFLHLSCNKWMKQIRMCAKGKDNNLYNMFRMLHHLKNSLDNSLSDTVYIHLKELYNNLAGFDACNNATQLYPD